MCLSEAEMLRAIINDDETLVKSLLHEPASEVALASTLAAEDRDYFAVDTHFRVELAAVERRPGPLLPSLELSQVEPLSVPALPLAQVQV